MKRIILGLLFILALSVCVLGQSNPPLRITEVDGRPTKTNATRLNFPNGTLTVSGNTVTYTPAGGGLGDVVGPGSATDNAIVRFDGTTGKLVQNSGITIDDTDNLASPGSITVTLSGGAPSAFIPLAGFTAHVTGTGSTSSRAYYGFAVNSTYGGSGTANAIAGAVLEGTLTGSANQDTGQGLNANFDHSGSGTLTNGLGADFKLINGNGTVTAGSGVKIGLQNAAGTVATFKGVNIAGWSNGGTVSTSYGIYMDTSIDVGATKFALYSLSASPSLLTGDLTVSGLLKAGSGPTTVTDAAGKVLSAALNTVAIGQGGTGQTTAANAINALLPTQTGHSGEFLTTNGTVASWAATAGGGSGADPTASVGLSAVNGAASTFMRSDAAPPLSQSIAPTWTGVHTFSPSARSSGSAAYLTLNAPADTGLTATAEAIGINIVGATRQHATGAITTQREFLFSAPTYSFVGASTITTAATVAINGAPVAGTNATITNKYGLLVQDADVRFTTSTADVGRVIFVGSTSGTQIPITGAGNRFMWLPGLGAIRAGKVSSTQWDSIGDSSAAFGSGNSAAGAASLAGGEGNAASGNHSFVTGFNNTASGDGAVAVGNSGSTASGLGSFAGGTTASATNDYSFAWGNTAVSSNDNAVAIGFTTTASGLKSFMLGAGFDGSNKMVNSVARSLAIGFSTTGPGGAITPQHLFRGKESSGSPNLYKINGATAAHETLAASTEAIDVLWDLNRTVQFSTGALTTQRAVRIVAPTYAFVGASTITTAATMSISGAPVAGTNATITTPYSFWIEGGASRFDGNVGIAQDDSATSTVTNILDLQHSSSGTPAANFGAGIRFGLETNTTANRDAGQINAVLTTATDASRTTQLQFGVVGNATAVTPLTLSAVNSGTPATGLDIKSNASGSGVTLTALGGTNENINLTPKGTGEVLVSGGLQILSGSSFIANLVADNSQANLRFLNAGGSAWVSISANGYGANPGGLFRWGASFADQGFDTGLNRFAAKVVAAGSASGTADHWLVDAGIKRVSTQFDKTSDTTLANVTGLSVTVQAGRTYNFVAELFTSSNSSGGVQAAIAGTATATAIVYEAVTVNGGALAAQTRATSLGTTVGGVTAVTAAHITITGTITVNAGGTLTVQFAQNASNGTASSVLVGSSFVVKDNP